VMYSPVVSCIPYMTNKTTSTRKGKTPAGGRSSRRNESAMIIRPPNPSPVGVAYNTQVVNSKPLFLPADGGVRIRHREYVGDVGTSSSGWALVNTLAINPGLSGVFPWLSLMAQNFESYELHALAFVYQASAPTSLAGTLYMAYDYDPADAPPSDKASMMSNMSAVAGSLWASNRVALDCKAARGLLGKFTRNTGIPTGTDIKTNDAANLNIAVEGVVMSSPGNIYVEYDVTLKIPQIPTNFAAGISQRITYGGTTGISLANDGYVGAPILISQAGSLSIGRWLCNQAGQYLVEYAISATTSGANTAAWTIVSGTAAVTDLGYAALPTSGTALGIFQAILNVADAGAILQLSLANVASLTTYYMRVAKYAYSFS